MFAGFQDKDKGSKSAKKLKEESSGRLHTLQLDVTSEEQILAAAAYVKENLPQGTSGKMERTNVSLTTDSQNSNMSMLGMLASRSRKMYSDV